MGDDRQRGSGVGERRQRRRIVADDSGDDRGLTLRVRTRGGPRAFRTAAHRTRGCPIAYPPRGPRAARATCSARCPAARPDWSGATCASRHRTRPDLCLPRQAWRGRSPGAWCRTSSASRCRASGRDGRCRADARRPGHPRSRPRTSGRCRRESVRERWSTAPGRCLHRHRCLQRWTSGGWDRRPAGPRARGDPPASPLPGTASPGS